MNGGLFPVLLLGFVAATVLAVALWAHALFWRRRIAIALPYAETHRIATADKSAIELRRITQPVAQVLPPVLLVHGIAINHRNMDTHPDYSLARALAKTGRDVWLLTLRSGRSDLSAAERKTPILPRSPRTTCRWRSPKCCRERGINTWITSVFPWAAFFCMRRWGAHCPWNRCAAPSF